MNIVIFGAGSIGSLFGGLLAKNNRVALIGRKKHVEMIISKGLKIQGKTDLKINVEAFENIENIVFSPDFVIISVKSFDTEIAAKKISKIIDKKTCVISLQNGLDNVEKISRYVEKDKIFVCITTHGSMVLKPGVINHTGLGTTKIGSIYENNTDILKKIVKLFNQASINTQISQDIIKDIWIKGIINSSINTLTTIFDCKNGCLLENPVLERFVDVICKESTFIANTNDFDLDYLDMIKNTKEVINDTKDNYSSMLQSFKKGKFTEIDSINGVLVKQGKKAKVDVFLNEILIHFIKSL